jgi:hypothetical protein
MLNQDLFTLVLISTVGMGSRHMLPKSLPGWADCRTSRALKAPTVHMLRLYVVLYVTSILGGEGTLEAEPVARVRLLHVSSDHVIES